MKDAKVEDNEFNELLAANPYKPSEPALYKESSLCRAAKAAFKNGEKTFKAKKTTWKAYHDCDARNSQRCMEWLCERHIH